MISEKEQEARDCLRVGSVLVHPQYLPKESNPYEKLKVRCRDCWHLREHFPRWVKDLVEQWAKEKGNAA